MIGEKAGLGAATLYGYVQDKRDLVWMLFDEDHVAITTQALAGMRENIGFLDQSINGFRFYYQYFARNPRFAEAVLCHRYAERRRNDGYLSASGSST
jgi:AcrR family transcriptional regulator